jgi:hypothetical protein
VVAACERWSSGINGKFSSRKIRLHGALAGTGPSAPTNRRRLAYQRGRVPSIILQRNSLTRCCAGRLLGEYRRFLFARKRLLYRLHLKKRGEEIHAVLNDYRGPQIPHTFEVGSEWVGLMEQDAGFEDWLKTDKLHCAVDHSFSKRPVPPKIIRGPSSKL